MWDVERRTMGRDMFEVEMAGREENLLGVGVGVVGRFCCSVVVGEVVAVLSQPTEADRPRLKNLLRLFLLRGNRRFFEGVLGEECCSCSGEAPWTSVEVGLVFIACECGCGCGDVKLSCVMGEEGSVNNDNTGENRERAEGRRQWAVYSLVNHH